MHNPFRFRFENPAQAVPERAPVDASAWAPNDALDLGNAAPGSGFAAPPPAAAAAPAGAAAGGASAPAPRRSARRARAVVEEAEEEEETEHARAPRRQRLPSVQRPRTATAVLPVLGAAAQAPALETAPAASAPPPPAAPPLPPLPTFAPRAVEPLQGDTLGHACERLTEDGSCGICFELLLDPHALACGHAFCGPCGVEWLRAHAVCPMCRARAGKPTPVRLLSDVIEWLAAGALDAEQKAAREVRKLEWQATQLRDARELREAELGRTAKGRPMAAHSDAAIQVAAAATAPLPMLNTLPADAVAWSVEYASSGRTVCHTCYARVDEGAVRVVRDAALQSHGPVRDFHHLACFAPRCLPKQLRGAEALRPWDRRRVMVAMARAARASAAAA